MISAYKTALYLSKKIDVVVLTTGLPRYEKLNPRLTVYRMPDIFFPDPINYSVIPGLFYYLWRVIKIEKPTHFLVNKHMFFTTLSVIPLRLLGKKVVTATDSFPTIDWFPRNRRLVPLMWAYSFFIGIPLLRLSNKVVLLHGNLLPIAKKLGLNAMVINNGVDLDSIDKAVPARDIPRPKGTINIVYVGRLESVKGYDDLLAVAVKMCKKNSKVHFYFVGNSENKAELIKQYSHISGITFLGHRNDVPSVLKRMDIFVLPSYSEGLPNALMEAMATGLACIATPVGGVPELVADNETGRLFAPGDRAALRGIIEALTCDVSECSQLGHNARQVIEKEFNWSIISQKYIELFKEMC